MSISERLAQYDEDYQEVETPAGFEDLPDGTYEAMVDGLRVKEQENSNRLQLEWEMKIADGKFQGRLHWDYQQLENDASWPWVKKRFETAGVTLDKLSDLGNENLLAQVIGSVLEIRLKTDGEYQNMYVNKLVTSPSSKPQETHGAVSSQSQTNGQQQEKDYVDEPF